MSDTARATSEIEGHVLGITERADKMILDGLQDKTLNNPGNVTKVAQQISYSTFTCFSRLPKEIRLIIWQFAQCRRVIHLVYDTPHRLLTVEGCSKSLLAVNSESFQEAKCCEPGVLIARPWDRNRQYISKMSDIIYLDRSVFQGGANSDPSLRITPDAFSRMGVWWQVLNATREAQPIRHLMIHQDFLLYDCMSRDKAFSHVIEIYVIVHEGTTDTQTRLLTPRVEVRSNDLMFTGCDLQARRISAGRLNSLLLKLEVNKVAMGQQEIPKLFAMVHRNVLSEGL